MSFSRAWLAMREPYDHAARAPQLADAWSRALPYRPGGVHLVDLGGGTGSNVRYLAPRLACPQRWWVIDRDPALIGALPEVLDAWARRRGWGVASAGDAVVIHADTGAIRVEGWVGELGATSPWPDVVDDADGITTQALLDLVGEDWLHALARARANRPLLAALTVDGRVTLHPHDPDDDEVLAAFRAHQRHGKPGIAAAAFLAGRLAADGAVVSLAEADWRLPPGDEGMRAAMIDGFAAAAGERGATVASAWRIRRRAAPVAVHVGHLDLLAVGGAGR